MNTLREMLGRRRSREPQHRDQFLRRYGLLRNPFPPARTILPEVMYNQQDALRKFANAVDSILHPDEISRRSIAVLGGTGAGKTHFLRHCQYLFEGYVKEEGDARFVVVEFQAGTSSASSLLKDILRRVDESCAQDGETDLVTALINARLTSSDLAEIKLADLKNALTSLVDASEEGYTPKDRAQIFTFDHLKEVAKRWFAGATLTSAEKTHLNVASRLQTASIMTRVMSELFALAQRKEVLGGVMLCLDEVEAIFASGTSTSKIQTFLQDLRYLFDEAVKPNVGYSLLVISASTQRGAGNLRDYNFPLFQRLGFEVENREELKAITLFEEAREFANVYIDFEMSRFETEGSSFALGRSAARSLITDQDLEIALSIATPARRPWSPGTPASQAQLLEALHQIVEDKRNER